MKFFQTIPISLIYFLLTIFICFFGIKTTNAAEKNNSILKVENFFKNLRTLEADFIQVSPSGKTSEGKIFLDLPGKLRIDYNQPNNILITTKGFWIVIQNRELKSTNNIPLNQTPFSILLENKINFNNKDLILELQKKLGIIEVKVKIAKNKQAGELILYKKKFITFFKKIIYRDLISNS